jgi:hypothetical protein
VEVIEAALLGRFFRFHGDPKIYCFKNIVNGSKVNEDENETYICLRNIEDPKDIVISTLHYSEDFFEIVPEDLPSLIERKDGYTDKEEKRLRKSGDW